MRKSYLFLFLLSVIMWNCKEAPKRLTAEEYNQLPDSLRRLPEYAIQGIDLLDEDLEITLFASEPMMTNPTNMDIDAKGRVWICEAYNYRNQLNPRNPYNKKGDRIIIMEDVDGDGKADKSKVYYQGEDINAALGIAVLGNKVIVSCSPKVFVFTDTNGDDLPDTKEVLFEGIKGEQHDHGMHAFTFGPDGKLYFNYGNAGEGMLTKDGKPLLDDLGREITNSGKPYQEGMVFRSDLDGSNVEILGWNFRNNYEVAVDSYGRMWQSDNDDDGNRGTRINYVIDYGNYGYKDEMTRADWRVRRTNMEDSVYHQHWHLNDPGVMPNLLQTYAGSPTGITVYEGDLLPKKYQNQVVHCDAGPNVVRAYPVKKNGAGFSAEILPILDGSKRDQWFRPSDVTVAPDGSIFVADWYDPGVGGHAMADTQKGRIFRIAPKGTDYSVPKNDFKTPEGAAEALKSPNVAVRYLAWTALNAMQTKAENALLELWNGDAPRMRARALWLLGKIKGKEAIYLQKAAQDKDEDIRVTAVRLARELGTEQQAFYTQLAKDKSPQVRREVALAIRHKNYPEIWATLAQQYDGKDRWYLETLGVSADDQWDSFLGKWTNATGESWKTSKATQDIVWRSRGEQSIFKLAELIDANPEPRFYRALDFQQSANKNDILLKRLEKTTNTDEKVMIFKHFDENITSDKRFQKLLPEVIASITKVPDYLDIVGKYAIKNQKERLLAIVMNDEKNRYRAAEMLIQQNGIADFKSILSKNDKEASIKAIQIFGSIDKPIVTNYLISLFNNKALGIDLRKEAMRAMNGWDSEEVLWGLAQAKKIPDDVLEEAKGLLFGTWHADIREAANKFYGNTATTASKTDVAELMAMKGSGQAGKAAFGMYCQTCHMVNKQGNNFGPGLSQIGKKLSKEGLFNSILYPSEGISFGYEGSVIKMKDGSEIQGIISSKTENELLVRFPGMPEPKVYARKEVVSITEMKTSLMPQFPLKNQDFADLVAYLQTLK